MKPRSLVALRLADRDRIAKLLGLTGSDHDGEVVNAARLANRLVRDLGITWFDVLAVPATEPRPAPKPSGPDVLIGWPVRWQAAAHLCSAYGRGIIREKDLEFASKVGSYTRRPSEAQLVWLRDITERVLAGNVS